MIHKERIEKSNKNYEINGDFVLYWMQSSQRSEYNHALEFAIKKGNEFAKPVIVYFGITTDFPEANERHYQFMLEGLLETKKQLKERNIEMVIRQESPEEGVLKVGRNASIVVADKGYLDIEKYWRRKVRKKLNCPLFIVESDVIIPVTEASDKEEYAARTIRPKINNKLDKYL